MRKIAGVLFDTVYVRGDADPRGRRLGLAQNYRRMIEGYESVNGV